MPPPTACEHDTRISGLPRLCWVDGQWEGSPKYTDALASLQKREAQLMAELERVKRSIGEAGWIDID